MEKIIKALIGKDYKIGDVVYSKVTERIDEFSHKRYTNPEAEIFRTVLFKGIVQDINMETKEFKMKLEDNNNFEKDGQTFVFGFLNIIDNEIPKEKRGIYTYTNGLGEKLEENIQENKTGA